jgi:hypothetical protein
LRCSTEVDEHFFLNIKEKKKGKYQSTENMKRKILISSAPKEKVFKTIYTVPTD